MILNLIYLSTLLLVSPFLCYRAWRYKKYRDGWGQKILGLAPRLAPLQGERKRIWFHAVSVGEVNLLKPLVAELQATRPDWEFVVSATSKTGFELARRLFGDISTVFYCPLDFTWSVKRALRRIKPDALILVELELWPNLVKAARKRGVKIAIVNGRISDASFTTYNYVRRFLASTFQRVDLIIAQDELAAGYFRALSPTPERVVVSGSIKFDGIQTDRNNPKTQELARLVGVTPQDVAYLCGSTQAPEEVGAIETYRRLYREFPNLKLIVVPRHKERFEEVAKLLDASGFQWTRRSSLDPNSPPTGEGARILLVDALGELGAWWGLAQIAFVGGSWGNRGGQNMLEPAGYGAAVSFGPNTRNFRTIVETLLRAKSAVVVANVDESTAFVRKCLENVSYRETLGESARQIVLQNRGATRRTFDALIKLLEN